MKTGRIYMNRMTSPRRQQGVVLLIALIILVAMTLAGIGMMRSVDTGSVIAGNLAFQQATMHANDAGTNQGFEALVSVANTGNLADKTILEYSDGQPCSNAPGATAAGCNVPGADINLKGYRSTPMFACEVTHTCMVASNYTWWKDPANWADAPVVAVADPNTPGHDIAKVSYLIHRMCQSGGSPGAGGQLCQKYTQAATGCSKSQLLPCKSSSLFYRVTARSEGSRNTVTYSQMLVLVSE
jgi:type IV pilus assembly protein PilX